MVSLRFAVGQIDSKTFRTVRICTSFALQLSRVARGAGGGGEWSCGETLGSPLDGHVAERLCGTTGEASLRRGGGK